MINSQFVFILTSSALKIYTVIRYHRHELLDFSSINKKLIKAKLFDKQVKFQFQS